MIEIIPAVLPKNYEDMKNKIALVRGIVPVVQIDLCDGIFVKNKTWPFSTGGADDMNFHRIMNEEEGMPFWEDIEFELDFMVADAVENFDIYTKLGPKRVVFHVEAVGDLNEFKNFIEGLDVYIRDSIQIGIAININTEIDEKILSLINYVDFVQCMGIEKIGFQGQDFDERVLEQIKKFRKEFPDLIISVDGGVNFDTAQELVDAGANRLIVGSMILKSLDVRETISELENLK
jgi:ribulose-phosphate 3-epimerase